MLFTAFSILTAALVMPPIAYYLWMKNKSRAGWGFNRSQEYRPKVTLIIPTYNEAAVVTRKLENVEKLNYPDDKLEVIVVDSNSVDGTLDVCRDFLANTRFRFPVRLVSEEKRLGKSHALNAVLRFAEGDIIATSDADSYWDENVLLNAVSYFGDRSVGAITGRESITNLDKSVHAKSEGMYLRFYHNLRLGESKVYSTFIFNGGLAMYRRSALERFEDRPGYSDDVGTVVKMISQGYRCLYVPDAIFNDTAAHSLSGKVMLKSRRAQHLIAGIVQAIHLKLNHCFRLPWSIVLFNFYMHILLPFITFSVLVLAAAVYAVYFQFLWFIPIPVFFVLLFQPIRLFVISFMTGNVALLLGLINHFTKQRSTFWPKIEEMRTE